MSSCAKFHAAAKGAVVFVACCDLADHKYHGFKKVNENT